MYVKEYGYLIKALQAEVERDMSLSIVWEEDLFLEELTLDSLKELTPNRLEVYKHGEKTLRWPDEIVSVASSYWDWYFGDR